MSSPFDFAMREALNPSRNWHNCCGIFTRTAFGAPSIGDFDGDGSADAEDMWKAAKHKHPETDPNKIPRGVPVFWTGGRSDNGHAAVSRGDGSMWTTDLVRDGHVDVAPIADVARKWGLTLLGWTEDINGVTVRTPPAPKPEPVVKPEKADRIVGGKNAEDAARSLRKMKRQARKGKRPGLLAAAKAALAAITRPKK